MCTWKRPRSARSTWSLATVSGRSTRCGRPAPTSAELDRLVEHDLALERAVHRALGRDLHQPLALLLGELLGEAQDQVELGGRPSLSGLVLHLAFHVADVPALAPGVHLDGDRHARGEADGEHLLWVRPRVLAAVLLHLVDGERVSAHDDPVLVAPVLAPGGGFPHPLPLKSSGSGSSA